MKFLIVVDMQNDFLTGSLKNDAAVAIIDPIIDKIKNFDGYIIATRDTHQADYLSTQEGKKLPIKHCIENTEGWLVENKIDEAIRNKKNWWFINKASFGSKDLPFYINSVLPNNIKKVDEIELCGTCTGICVISNAVILKAAFPETKIIVDSKCCACISEETHKNALKAMELCQIEVI